MQKVIDIINQITEKTGKIISWLAVFMVVLISLDVIFRYLFNFTFIWMVELEIYLFGMLFLLGGAYTLKHKKHVRVDVFYTKLSEKGKAWIDLIGGILYLIPWAILIIVTSSKYAYNSFLMNEGSPQPGGLPALYILKFTITIAFIFFLLQGISEILTSLTIILKKKD